MNALLEQLEAMISSGKFSPGDRIPAERALASEFGVSRSRLREVIKQLTTRGLLASRRGGGTYVTSPDEAHPLRAALLPLAPLARQEAGYWRDVMELRKSLEADAAAFAAMRADAGDQARIMSAYDALAGALLSIDSDEDVSGGRLALARLDAQFHMAIVQGAHNAVLHQVMSGLEALLETSISNSLEKLYRLPDVPHQLDAQHRRILDAVLAGDAEQAKAAALEHLVFVEDLLAGIEAEAARQQRSTHALQHIKTIKEAQS